MESKRKKGKKNQAHIYREQTGGGRRVGKTGEGDQKVPTSSYKINKYGMVSMINKTILHI